MTDPGSGLHQNYIDPTECMYSGDLKSIVPTKVDLDARLPELINYNTNVFR